MSTISLCMIVKDESQVIERCLRSVLPLIDAWTVVDTGSSDDTPERVQSVLGHLPGQLHHRPWRNFAENRSEAFEFNQRRADYHLVMDADDWLQSSPGWTLPELQADSYELTVHHCGIHYRRPQIFRAALDWRFRGVLHEYADCPQAVSCSWLDGLAYWNSGGQGARSRNPYKYLEDAQLLESALLQEPENARYVFYLAQSYRDAGLLREASEAYRKRTQMHGWSEERYVSHLERARLLRRLQAPKTDIQAELLEAYQLNVKRAEALVELSQLYREEEQWNLGHFFAQAAAELPTPDDGLFLEEAAYAWKSLDELALAKFYTGRYADALEITQRLLSIDQIPQLDRERLQRNLVVCRMHQPKKLVHSAY